MTMRPIERNSWKHVSCLMQCMLSLFGLTVVTALCSHSFPWQFPHERSSVLRAAQPLQVIVADGHSHADCDICLRRGATCRQHEQGGASHSFQMVGYLKFTIDYLVIILKRCKFAHC